jgi:hypothetical protein
MTFGQIKTSIEKNLLESYKDQSEFRKTVKEFKSNILNDKTMSKLYSLYDQLNTPQSLTESEAKDFLHEGITLIQSILPNLRKTTSLTESLDNDYKDLDILVYSSTVDIFERVNARKNIIKILSSNKDGLTESINIPIKSMVDIANQTLTNFIENLDESSKKELIKVVTEDTERLKIKFDVLKEMTLGKLNNIKEQNEDSEIKQKITETINKIENEDFSQINYIRLKNLEQSI